jgi:hypothetical protein
MCLRGIGASQFLSWIWAVNRHGEVGRSVLFVSSPLLSSPLLSSLWVFQTASEDEMLSSSCSFMTIGSACTPISPILISLSEKRHLECGPLKRFFNLKSVHPLSLSHTHTQSLHPLFLLCACNQSKGQIELGVSSGYLFISFFLSLLIYLYFLYL